VNGTISDSTYITLIVLGFFFMVIALVLHLQNEWELEQARKENKKLEEEGKQ